MKIPLIALMVLMCGNLMAAAEPLVVPAFTAYIEPDPNGVKVSGKTGISAWTDSRQQIVWFGNLAAKGNLKISLVLRLPAGETAKLKLTVAGKTMDVALAGKGADAVTLEAGNVEIVEPGYHRFALEAVEKSGKTFGDVESILLDGPAVAGAHFNLKSRRNAASVHLGYPTPDGQPVPYFYNELTVRTDPLWSYYMACGFSRGYFGIQVNSPTERRIIFSVWDSGNEGVDRNKVKPEDRVQLIEKGEGVVTNDFGNEGTGGHSHKIYDWKKDQPYRFLVTAKVDGTHTTYAGYFFFPEAKKWGLIASFKAPKDGKALRGLYSFNENFVGNNGQLRRLAEFSNQWMKTADGPWVELTKARFTHDATGKQDRKDYGAGVIDGRFYLSNGGFTADAIKLGDSFDRKPGGGKPPEDFKN